MWTAIFKFLERFFGQDKPEPAPPAIEPNAYAAALNSEWTRYLKWRDEQVCVGCGKKYGDQPKGTSVAEWVDSGFNDELGDSMWVTETECVPCWKKGVRGGKTRADYQNETGNRFI